MADIDSCVAAWAGGDGKAREAAALTLGIKLDTKTAAAIDALLAKVNGNRKKFRLERGDVLRVIGETVASQHGIAVRHGGGEFNWKTTLCLGVKPAKREGIVIGLGQCWADKPTPGRVWTDVQPWQQDFAKNLDRARAWADAKKPDRIFVATTKPKAAKGGKAPGKVDGAKLFAEVLANPLDDGPRLVYADWLTQVGDPRGELITVQCAIATTPPRKRRALVAREAAILRKHRKAWMREAMQISEHGVLARGFIETITVSALAFANSGAGLLDHEPIVNVQISKPTGPSLVALGNAAHLARVHRLELVDPFWLKNAKNAIELHTFFRSKHLGKVRELDILVGHDPYIRGEPPDLSELFAGVSWPNVTSFALRHNGKIPTLYASLARAKMPALERLVGHDKAQLAAVRKAFPKAKIS